MTPDTKLNIPLTLQQGRRIINEIFKLKLWICSSLNIQKGLSESVNRRRIDNTMAKEKKGQTMIYKTLHRKLKMEHHELHFKWTKLDFY